MQWNYGHNKPAKNLCKQAVEKNLIAPICHADERRANHYGVSVRTVTSEGRATTDKEKTLKT
jgi:hypothetical protein